MFVIKHNFCPATMHDDELLYELVVEPVSVPAGDVVKVGPFAGQKNVIFGVNLALGAVQTGGTSLNAGGSFGILATRYTIGGYVNSWFHDYRGPIYCQGGIAVDFQYAYFK